MKSCTQSYKGDEGKISNIRIFQPSTIFVSQVTILGKQNFNSTIEQKISTNTVNFSHISIVNWKDAKNLAYM